MRITAIKLNEVGPFSSPVAIEGFGAGLNLLTGANELGKSTIFRALRVLFTEPYGGQKASLRRLRPHAGGAPEISCEFEIGGGHWALSKRYLTGKTAELREITGSRVFRDGDVEAALAELLATRGLSREMLDLLWVAQGDSFALPKTSAQMRYSIGEFIQAEAETVSGGGQLLNVHQAVQSRLGELVTDKHRRPRANGPYHTALMAEERARAALEAAEEKQRQSAARCDRLEELKRELDELANPERERQEQDTVARLQREIAAVEHAQGELKVLEERLERLQAIERDAARALKDFRRMRAERQQNAAELARLDAQIATTKDKLSHVQECARQHRERLETLTGERERLAGLKLKAEQAARYHHLLAQSQGLAARRNRVADVLKAQAGDRERFAAIAVDEPAFGRLSRQQQLLDEAEARLSAAAPRISVAYEAGRTGGIEIDGHDVGDGEERIVEHTVVVAIPGVGTVTIAPGRLLDADDPLAMRDQARAAFAEQLMALGAGSFADVEALVAEKRRLGEVLKRHDVALKNLVPDGVDALDQEIADVRASLAQVEPVAATPSEAFDDEALQRLLGDSAAAAAAVERDGKQSAALRETLAALSTKHAVVRDRLSALEAQLTGDGNASHEDWEATLAAGHESAERNLNDAVRERRAWQAKVSGSSGFEALKRDLADVEARRRDRAAKIQRARADAQAIEGALSRDLEDGIDGSVELCRDRLTAARAQLEMVERDVAALELLDRELSDLRSRRSDAVSGPIAARIVALAQPVLPDVTAFDLSDDLAVAGVQRDRVREPLNSLSDGTREQIAVLARLALCDVLTRGGIDAPVIFDDALVYADDSRLGAIFAVLGEVAKRRQVIVMSCHERSFSPLVGEHGARQLRLAAGEQGSEG